MDGAPYFVAVRLVLIAKQRWVEIDGEAALKGAPSLMALPPDRFCNAVYVWCISRIHKEEELAQWEFRLTEPPPTVKVTPAIVAAEMDSFDAFAGAFGVKAPSAR